MPLNPYAHTYSFFFWKCDKMQQFILLLQLNNHRAFIILFFVGVQSHKKRSQAQKKIKCAANVNLF